MRKVTLCLSEELNEPKIIIFYIPALIAQILVPDCQKSREELEPNLGVGHFLLVTITNGGNIQR
jgi:hypothetical protein